VVGVTANSVTQQPLEANFVDHEAGATELKLCCGVGQNDFGGGGRRAGEQFAFVRANDMLQDQRAVEARIPKQWLVLVLVGFAEALKGKRQIEHARGRTAGAYQ